MPDAEAPSNLPVAVFLMGPTATGKTALAVELVRRLPFEIVSVDSAMVYRGMDIGTAKPDRELQRIAPHRLIDILDPAESYSAGRFREDAIQAMRAIHERGRIPLLVGGTMLYFHALERGLSALPSASAEIRAALEADAVRCGWPGMHRRLAAVDPGSARRIHPNDPQRIQRALEVYEATGRTLSELRQQGVQGPASFRFIKLALIPADRGCLQQRIESRFRDMLKQGFLDEVRQLYARGDLGPEMPSMRAVGYRQAWRYLAGELDAQRWVDAAIGASRHYAKRQMTWLRGARDLCALPAESGSVLEQACKQLNLKNVLNDLKFRL